MANNTPATGVHKQRCGAHRHELQDEQCRRMRRQQSCNPLLNA
jgi:hypothetical protein